MRIIPSGAPILTAAAMRAAELGCGIPIPDLMQRAGAAVAREVARLAVGRPILVVAGPGKNGGDARIAASILADLGHDVAVCGIDDLSHAAPRSILVDGLFGTGLSSPLEPGVSQSLTELARAADLVIAIDLPSGLQTDTGASLGAPHAQVTIALGALKPAHVLGDGVAHCGHVILHDLGIAAVSDWRTIARPTLAPPTTAAHKFTRGMVAVVGGAMPGAARLAARAAMHGGAGYVVLTGNAGGPDALVHRDFDDALLADDRVGALLIGPGLGRGARATLDRAIASDRPLVIDGDALSMLGGDAIAILRRRATATILTPHTGEFDRMFGAGHGSKIDRTLAAAAATGCTIVHKGADTVVADPAGRVVVSAAASPWLASAGTGDVLAGLVAARLATGGRTEDAVWLHMRAASIAGPALIADRLVDAIPAAMEECLWTTA